MKTISLFVFLVIYLWCQNMFLQVPRTPQYGLGLMPWHKASLTAWLQHVPLHSPSSEMERRGDKKGHNFHSLHSVIKFRTPN